MLGERYAARSVYVAAGLKRAALFALGTSVAAACGGRTAGESQGVEPIPTADPSASVTAIYGAPVAPATATPVTPAVTPTPVFTDPGPTTPVPTSTGVEIPPYGAPFPTTMPITTMPGQTTVPIETTVPNTIPTTTAAPTSNEASVESMSPPDSSAWIDESSSVGEVWGPTSEQSWVAPSSSADETSVTLPPPEETAPLDAGVPDASL